MPRSMILQSQTDQQCFIGVIPQALYSQLEFNLKIYKISTAGVTTDVTDILYYDIGSIRKHSFKDTFKELISELQQQSGSKTSFSQSVTVLQQTGATFTIALYLDFEFFINETHIAYNTILTSIDRDQQISITDSIDTMTEEQKSIFKYLQDFIDYIRKGYSLYYEDGLGYNSQPAKDYGKNETAIRILDGAYQTLNYLLPIDLPVQLIEMSLRRTSNVLEYLDTGVMFYPQTIPNLIGDAQTLLDFGMKMLMFNGLSINQMARNTLYYKVASGAARTALIDPFRSVTNVVVPWGYEQVVHPIRQYNNTNMFFNHFTKQASDSGIAILSELVAHGGVYALQRYAANRLPRGVPFIERILAAITFANAGSFLRESVPQAIRFVQQPTSFSILDNVESVLQKSKNLAWMEQAQRPVPTQTTLDLLRAARYAAESGMSADSELQSYLVSMVRTLRQDDNRITQFLNANRNNFRIEELDNMKDLAENTELLIYNLRKDITMINRGLLTPIESLNGVDDLLKKTESQYQQMIANNQWVDSYQRRELNYKPDPLSFNQPDFYLENQVDPIGLEFSDIVNAGKRLIPSGQTLITSLLTMAAGYYLLNLYKKREIKAAQKDTLSYISMGDLRRQENLYKTYTPYAPIFNPYGQQSSNRTNNTINDNSYARRQDQYGTLTYDNDKLYNPSRVIHKGKDITLYHDIKQEYGPSYGYISPFHPYLNASYSQQSDNILPLIQVTDKPALQVTDKPALQDNNNTGYGFGTWGNLGIASALLGTVAAGYSLLGSKDKGPVTSQSQALPDIIEKLIQEEIIQDILMESAPETREFQQRNTLLLSRKLRSELQNFKRRDFQRMYDKLNEEENDTWHLKRKRRDFAQIHNNKQLKRRRL